MSDSPGLELRRVVEETSPRLLEISEIKAEHRPGSDRWSAKEILGHLIDSATNNHQRFVRAQFKDDLLFDGYEQNEWVIFHGYQDADWKRLRELWRELNLHVASVMDSTAPDTRLKSRREHSLDRIAWRTIPREKPATLDYLMRDYIGHLRHHLGQLFDQVK